MRASEIRNVLEGFKPIRLEEMEKVRLMDRIDTKYVMPVSRLPELLIRMDGGYKVLEISNFRTLKYMTTYLDTTDFQFFNQHVTGRIGRNKVRFRKYEVTGSTFLEVKRRTKKNRTIKWRIENDLTSANDCDDKACEFIKGHILQDNLKLNPVLINHFKRITLVGTEQDERITIDYDISFADTNGNISNIPSVSVIELKRKGFTNRTPTGIILKDFSVYPTGFSKYCVGTALLNDLPKKNLLKEKLLLINKMENGNDRWIND